jgi:hypothetical protein
MPRQVFANGSFAAAISEPARATHYGFTNERNYPSNFTRSLPECLHALCIYTRRDAASTTQKMKRSVRATQNTEAQDTTTQEATERYTKRAAKRKRP